MSIILITGYPGFLASSLLPRIVYHLSDPEPLTVAEVISELGQACQRRILSVPVPRRPTQALLRHAAPLARWSGFTPAMVDYFVHPTHYPCDNTLRALGGTKIACPDMRRVLPRLVEYVRRHPHPVG